MTYHIWKKRNSKGKQQWWWHLKGENNEIIASGGGEGYNNKADALHAIDLVRSSQDAPVKVKRVAAKKPRL